MKTTTTHRRCVAGSGEVIGGPRGGDRPGTCRAGWGGAREQRGGEGGSLPGCGGAVSAAAAGLPAAVAVGPETARDTRADGAVGRGDSGAPASAGFRGRAAFGARGGDRANWRSCWRIAEAGGSGSGG